MPEIRVTDEQGNIHVFPDGSTPDMISRAMGLKPQGMVDQSQPTQFERDRVSDVGLAPVQRAVAKAAGKPAPDLSNVEPTVQGRLVPKGSTAEALPYAAANNTLYPGVGTAAAGVRDISKGNIARGAHGVISGGFDALSTATPSFLASSPVQLGKALLGGTVGSEIGSRGAKALGATDDQAALAGDVGGIAGGTVALNAKVPNSRLIPTLENRTSAIRNTVPEAMNVPPKALVGGEKVFRAAAPVGSYPEFRADQITALGDLAEIGRKVDLSKSAGGTSQPDMRVRASVNAINEHLKQMYDTERAPQIDRNAQNPVQTKFGTDATEGLDFLSRKAGNSELQSLAAKAMNNEHMTLAEMDKLEKLNSAELRSYNGMTPQDKSALEMTNPKIGALKPLDAELNQRIASELENRGEAGIKEYGQRYAALSGIRDQLRSRMNAVELQRTNMAGRAARAVIGGAKGIASASQAAVSDVNIGRMLQQGFQNLADSGLTATRGIGKGAPVVRGLLPPPTTTLPASSLQTPASAPAMRIDATTRAQRLGLLLPERTGGAITTPVPGALPETVTPQSKFPRIREELSKPPRSLKRASK